MNRRRRRVSVESGDDIIGAFEPCIAVSRVVKMILDCAEDAGDMTGPEALRELARTITVLALRGKR